ncbi:MAG TPA: hypothetical protein PKD85_01030 [Saprospiraceae bacterium]|nr:hypothetical protein [Saprospiraceae bacterium]
MSFFQHLPNPPVLKTSGPTRRTTKDRTNESKKESSTPRFYNTKPSKPRPQKDSRANRSVNEKIDTSVYDILYIDEQIKALLKSRVSTLDDMQKNLSQLLWIVSNGIDNVDKINAKTETAILRRTIKDVEGGFDLGLYLLKTTDLLNEYKELVAQTRSVSFVQIKAPKDDEKNHKKAEIKATFLRIAKDYIPLENFVQKPSSARCEFCHGQDFQQGEIEHVLICNKCGVQMEILDDAPTFKDSERVNMSARYTYTCKGHFIEAMNRFEGKQNTEIPISVIEILKTELALHGLNVKYNKNNITKDHIYMFLREKSLSEYYADINLIYFLITEINPPDITEYRSELLEMLEQLEEAYKSVKESTRTNSLNVNWKLYKLLQLIDYPCQKDDFFCLKTPTKEGEHEEKWYEMIEYLKSRYPDYKTSKGRPRWRHIRSI